MQCISSSTRLFLNTFLFMPLLCTLAWGAGVALRPAVWMALSVEAVGDPIDATLTSDADSSHQFHYSGGQYMYNLSLQNKKPSVLLLTKEDFR